MPNQSEKDRRPAIEVRGLSKSYGPATALREVDLAVPKGTCLGLFGPNGAGKSTLIGVLCTLVRPSSGSAFVAGHDVRKEGQEVRRALGVISHQAWVYGRMSAADNLRFFARLYGMRRPEERIAELLDRFDLSATASQEVRTFSRGMKQRLTIARALLPDPPILLLDEPFTGLDRRSASRLRERLTDLRGRGRTVLLVTHNLHEGWELADRAALLVRGRLVHECSTAPGGLEKFIDTADSLAGGDG